MISPTCATEAIPPSEPLGTYTRYIRVNVSICCASVKAFHSVYTYILPYEEYMHEVRLKRCIVVKDRSFSERVRYMRFLMYGLYFRRDAILKPVVRAVEVSLVQHRTQPAKMRFNQILDITAAFFNLRYTVRSIYEVRSKRCNKLLLVSVVIHVVYVVSVSQCRRPRTKAPRPLRRPQKRNDSRGQSGPRGAGRTAPLRRCSRPVQFCFWRASALGVRGRSS